VKHITAANYFYNDVITILLQVAHADPWLWQRALLRHIDYSSQFLDEPCDALGL